MKLEPEWYFHLCPRAACVPKVCSAYFSVFIFLFFCLCSCYFHCPQLSEVSALSLSKRIYGACHRVPSLAQPTTSDK